MKNNFSKIILLIFFSFYFITSSVFSQGFNVYVTNFNNFISLIESSTNTIADTIAHFGNPTGIVATPTACFYML